ncbi:DUF6175 family protein [Croceibacter atlanticus]|jgi:hypothetical protein|uniref:Uncharacterized protein n=1 Tax=Croceibacter atlanticus (strain ATCC BAA-628 / JCM 21780 / CIP 108009 / IAM 15332 / KCTC 12090 / HTCC2559) TaxID=216432 RepID=A3UBK1_CROAH|nr:DUF6175 family protein [Croceibacter atlanticus]EAP86002.1 hypothetical protein CA2559_08216 [Croceibacter atlanticus HTCC2559]
MRKIITLLLLAVSTLAIGQAKKPTLMVVPSDAWCIQNGYSMNFENQGTVETIPDYKAAFQNDPDLLLVISKINGLMADRGFPLQNMESVIKSLNSYSAEDALRSSKSGGEVEESPIDRFKAVAKADIIMQLTWTLNKTGPKRSVTFNLQGLDAYSNKQIATAAGTGAPSFSAELPVLLEESVLSHMDNFTNSLQNHFDDLFENGREIKIRIKRWDDWDEDLESSFGPEDEELSFIIEDWIADNTVKGRFSTTDATENMMIFDQVRIPLYFTRNGRERAMDTRRFAKGLSDMLKNSPYNIVNKLTTRGLGEATIFLGSK